MQTNVVNWHIIYFYHDLFVEIIILNSHTLIIICFVIISKILLRMYKICNMFHTSYYLLHMKRQIKNISVIIA